MQVRGTLTDISSLNGTLTLPESVRAEPYHGQYDITPKAYDDQVFETIGKVMTDNIVIRKVPYVESHNESGTTVYIAKEDNYNG